MKKNVIFGAGSRGERANYYCTRNGMKIDFFADNDKKKQGELFCGIPVISMEELKANYADAHIIVALWGNARREVVESLKGFDYEIFNEDKIEHGERLITCCQTDLQDVILYHVLKEQEDVFYIDVGANDPVRGSVTKLLYDMKAAHGINIEPVQHFFDLLQSERKRDVNLCFGLGAERKSEKFYVQSGGSTTDKANLVDTEYIETEIEIHTLEEICDAYVSDNQEIHFLKIDVEGYEREVLEGGNFIRFRPWIIDVESTIPRTNIPSYSQWESLLLTQGYQLAFEHDINRYYVAKEREELSERFIPVEQLKELYEIFTLSLGCLSS